MTFQNVRLKIASPALKLKSSLRLPSSIITKTFITVSQASGVYTIGADYTVLDPTAIIDPSATLMAIYDTNSKSFKAASLSTLIAEAGQIVQTIINPGPVAINNNTGIVVVNQTVGAAITLNMPLSTAKTCPVLISDWKADSDVHPITVNLAGADQFPGGLTSWTINARGASIFLRPIPGLGYTL